MIDIVSRKVHGDIPQRLDASFGVNTEHVPFLGGQRLQEFQVRDPQSAVERERLANVTRAVPSRARPDVLIESLNCRARRRKNQANSISADQFVISKVRDNFPDTPFPRSRTLREIFCRETRYESGKNIGGFGLKNEWVGASLVAKDSFLVFIDRH